MTYATAPTLALALVGFGVGTFGTLIGAGGGFILMPLFFFLYPTASPDELAAISLAIVALNAVSGSIPYALDKKIDYRSGLAFAAAAIPGSIFGAICSSYIPRGLFEPLFGILLASISIYLFWKSFKSKYPKKHAANSKPHIFNLRLGIGLSFIIGFISTLLGIGGGVIHVPVLVYLLQFSVPFATATSHFVLAITATVGTITHVFQGNHGLESLEKIAIFAPGVIIGAQVGAHLSKKIHSSLIVRALSLCLIFIALRLILKNL